MAGKVITQFGIVAAANVSHVVAVLDPGPSVVGDAKLVPFAELKGDKGDKGDTGSTGSTGAAGANGTNGAPGATGSTGATGAQGNPGVPGPSVIPNEYGIFDEAKVTAIVTAAVDWIFLIVAGGDDRVNKTLPAALNGDKSGHLVMYDVTGGSVWRDFGPIVGIQGETGPTGADGAAGVDGADGAAGTDGAQGAQGVKGDKGDKGDPGDIGPPGIQGAEGPTGAPGTPGATGATGAPGVVPLTTIIAVTTTTHTLLLADTEKYHRFTNASPKTITVPTNATAAFPYTADGETTTIAGINAGAGLLTLAAAGGVTINKKALNSLTLAQWGSFVLTKVGTDEWDLIGDLELA